MEEEEKEEKEDMGFLKLAAQGKIQISWPLCLTGQLFIFFFP